MLLFLILTRRQFSRQILLKVRLTTVIMVFLYFLPLFNEQMRYNIVNNTKKFAKFSIYIFLECDSALRKVFFPQSTEYNFLLKLLLMHFQNTNE